jgi:hypothetical protein
MRPGPRPYASASAAVVSPRKGVRVSARLRRKRGDSAWHRPCHHRAGGRGVFFAQWGAGRPRPGSLTGYIYFPQRAHPDTSPDSLPSGPHPKSSGPHLPRIQNQLSPRGDNWLAYSPWGVITSCNTRRIDTRSGGFRCCSAAVRVLGNRGAQRGCHRPRPGPCAPFDPQSVAEPVPNRAALLEAARGPYAVVSQFTGKLSPRGDKPQCSVLTTLRSTSSPRFRLTPVPVTQEWRRNRFPKLDVHSQTKKCSSRYATLMNVASLPGGAIGM